MRISRKHLAAYSILLALSFAGCNDSGKVTVTGRVTRTDGTPLVGARVTFRSNATGKWASGTTDSDGRYELGTAVKGDGILPGDYYVIVVENRGNFDHPRPRTISEKYEHPQHSGLVCTIKEAEPTVYDLVLEQT